MLDFSPGIHMKNHFCLKFVSNYDFLLVFLTLKTTGYSILEFARTFIKISHEKINFIGENRIPYGYGNTFKLTLKFIVKSFFLTFLTIS